MSTADVIENMVAEYESTRKEFVEKGKIILKGAFTDFFKENPEVKALKWTQYTPYFNDGDECVFGVNDREFSHDGENFVDHWSFRDDTTFSPMAHERFKDFNKLLDKIPDEIFKDLFGNHVEVIATNEGFTVEDYEHE